MCKQKDHLWLPAIFQVKNRLISMTSFAPNVKVCRIAVWPFHCVWNELGTAEELRVERYVTAGETISSMYHFFFSRTGICSSMALFSFVQATELESNERANTR
jgi:hypothetical protein